MSSTTCDALTIVFAKAPREGDIIRLPLLAKTLETVAEKGREGFYSGWVAEDGTPRGLAGALRRALEGFGNTANDALLLLFGQFRINRQGQRLSRGSFGLRGIRERARLHGDGDGIRRRS